MRAALVPLAHDEAATFQTYVLTGNYLPYLAHWDAGNHLLVTAVARGSYLLFGDGPLALRGFPVLCFLLWAWYALRFALLLEERMIRCALFTALLLMPFVAEFFALFRGYGPSLAFLLMALFHAVRFTAEARRTDLVLLLVAMLLACAASLTLIMFWCMLLAGSAVVLLRNRRRDASAWAALLIIGALPLLLAAHYSFELSARGLLYYGTGDGLLSGTLASLSKWVLGIGDGSIGALIMLLPIPIGAWALRAGRHRMVISGLMLLILGELLGRFILAEAFGVLYPQDRTAMHLVPVLLLLFAFSVSALTNEHAWWPWASVILFVLPLRTAMGLNFDRTSFWPEQAIPAGVFEAVMDRQAQLTRPLVIGGYHQHAAVWAYGSMRRNGSLPMLDVNGFPQPTCDLMLIDRSYFQAPPGFSVITEAPHGKLTLMQRDPPLVTTIVMDTALIVQPTDAEFIELLVVEGVPWFAEESLIEVDAVLRSVSAPLDVRLVVEVKAADGTSLHYDVVDAQRVRAQWQGEDWREIRRAPAHPNASRLVCYLWNPQRHVFSADHVQVRAHRVLDP
ncbi:MAG TPA: hypothetical protein PKY96_00325 [Flavobacteriales bacterium]|nr:hypothetical protein [Flavobacteriales bacterium]HRD51069.1 hypothetical protein [Flavobacteriales bacterium]